MSHPWLRGYSTIGMASPFRISLKDQNIDINSQETKNNLSQFLEDTNFIIKEKAFFNRSFVNKTLV